MILVAHTKSARAIPSSLSQNHSPRCSPLHKRCKEARLSNRKLHSRYESRYLLRTSCSAGVHLPEVILGTAVQVAVRFGLSYSVVLVLSMSCLIMMMVFSATGISMASLATEISCYASLVAYGTRRGYAPTIWGAELACWIQDASLLLLVSYLRNVRPPVIAGVSAVWLLAQAMLFTEFVPMWFLSKFQIFVGLVLGLGARVPQIFLNIRNGHTGNLAALTFIFNATANSVCFISATVLTGDMYVIATQVWMFILNCTILSQIFTSERKAKDEAASNSAVSEESPLSMSGKDELAQVGLARRVSKPDEVVAKWYWPVDRDAAHRGSNNSMDERQVEPKYVYDM